MSDGSIRQVLALGQIQVSPPIDEWQRQPCSIDLRLSDSFCWPAEGGHDQRIRKDQIMVPVSGFVLGCTIETVTVGRGFMGQVHGKSTWARRGLVVEAAGLVDPGFSGQLTLEIFNMSSRPLPLFAGEAICQITFERLDYPAERPYGHVELNSHYQGQVGATPAGGVVL